MKFFRWFGLSFLLLGTLWLGFSSPTSPATNHTRKVIVYPSANDSISQFQQRGLGKAIDYGAYWLVEVPDAQFDALQKAFPGHAEQADYLNVLELSSGSVDTSGPEPTIPARLRDAAPRGERLRLVQFQGPVLPEWLAQLKAIKQLRVVNYVPNNGYLVSVSESAEQQLQTLVVPNGPVQWIGAYHPFYKIPATLQQAVGTVEVRIAILDGPDAAGALRTVASYALADFESHQTAVGQWLVTMKVNANDLAAIAQLPAVLWIQPSLPITKRDELQALVLAGDTSPADGDSYLAFLNSVGFPTDSSQYPVLDICDTGVDTPSPYCKPVTDPFSTWHPAFYHTSHLVSPDLACCDFGNSRKVYIAGGVGDDTDGHGTRVASVAVGFDTEPDEKIIDCITNIAVEVCTTNSVLQCVTNGFTVGDSPACSGPTPPPCCADLSCTNWNITCSTVQEITCVTNCVVFDAAVDVAKPPPPWYLSRRDSQGFQLGLGVSPYGPFGVSSMTQAQANPESVVQAVYLTRGRISNNSWTEALSVGANDGAYDGLSQSYDALTRDAVTTGTTNSPGQPPRNQEMLFIFAAGNDNGSSQVGGFGDVLITPPATAKNVITVGATTLYHPAFDVFALSDFSSFGPTRDGRFKPDVVAPGGGVAAAISQASYTHASCGGCDPNNPDPPPCPLGGLELDPVVQRLYNNLDTAVPFFTEWPNLPNTRDVTSYSAPAVAGGAQLLYHYFIDPLMLSNLPPSAAMMKAYILNSARYLPIINPITGALDKLPSIGQGMGMMDLGRMFDGIPRVLRDESTPRAIDLPLYSTNVIPQQTFFSAPGQSYEVSGQVANAAQPFRVTLAWTDPPGNPAVLKQLVNDLDLVVTINGQTYYGNHFDTQYSAASPQPVYDRLNNVESVFLPAGLPVGTPWSVMVRATVIAGDGVPNVGTGADQDYALVVYNAANPSDVPNTDTNNTCQTPVLVTAFPFTWTNQLSTAVYKKVHPNSTAGRGGVEEFFEILHPTIGTTFTVDTFGSGFDTVLSVWRGTCGALVEQAANNDSSNTFQSAVSFTANGVDDYYIIAEPHNGGPGGQLVLNVHASVSPVVLSPSNVIFPDQILGTTSAVQTVTLQNGLPTLLNVLTAGIQGPAATSFLLVADNCAGAALQTNTTCTMSVVFAPQATGTNTAQLVVTDDATGSPRIVPLLGVGLPPAPLVCLNANRLVFSNQAVSTTSPVQDIIVRNCGTADLVLSNAVVSGAASNDFTATSVCGANATIAAGATCTIHVDFTPSTNGIRNALLSLTDTAGDSPQTVLLSGVGCGTITLQPAALPAATAGAVYNQTLTASGGVGPFQFAVTAGVVPPGLTLSGNGVIAGTPTTVGPVTFTVTATDAVGCSGSQQFTITVNCPSLTLQPPTLPGGLQGTAYTNMLTVVGGVAPITFNPAPLSGSLPTGLTLATNGVLAGTLQVPGTNTFTLGVTDANSCTGSQSYTIIVSPAQPLLGFVPNLLPTFGDVVLGSTSSVQSVTVTNLGTAALIITNLSVAGTDPNDFVLAPGSCLGTPVPPGGTCAVNVQFAPTTNANRSADVVVWDNATGNPHSFSVKGAGIAPVIAPVPASLDFGTQTVSVASAPQWIQVDNPGDAPLAITNVTVIGANQADFPITTNSCLSAPIQPGSSCSIGVSFKPGAVLSRTATLVISGNGTNSPQQVSLVGVGSNTAPSLGFNPASLVFGDTPLGTTGAVQSVTVTNGGTANLLIKQVDFSGSQTDQFVLVSTGCVGPAIVPGGSCAIQVAFAPTQPGLITNASLRVLSNSGNGTNTVPLNASGIAPDMALSTLVLDFGTNNVGVASAPQSVTVTNVGDAALVINNVAVSGLNPGDFTVAGNTCQGGPILPGLSCRITVTFKTTTTLARSALLTITANAANSPQVVTLQGVGKAFSCPTIVLTPTNLPNAFPKVNYLQNITASGGTAPYAFAVSSGSLPQGMNLSAGGVISGSPTNTGAATFTVTATDANGCSGSQQYILNVTCPTITLSPTTLPSSFIGYSYRQTIFASGGTVPYAFTVSAGTLPTGLSLSSTGLITGTLTANGTFDFTVTATDTNGCTGARAYTVGVSCVPIVLYPTTLPNGTVGAAYSQAVFPLGGTAPFQFAVATGTLPPGLSLANNGLLSGTPTTPTNATFTIAVTDANHCVGSNQYTVAMNCGTLTLSPPSLPSAGLGVAYHQPIAVNGAIFPVTYRITAGALPTGLAIDSSGAISGTTTGPSGTYNFRVQVTDAAGCSGERFYSLAVGCAGITVASSPGSLPFGQTGQVYSNVQFVASGGTAPYTFAVTSGSLPAGLMLASNGTLSGTPTAGGSAFTVTATDAGGCQGATAFTLSVALVPPQIVVTPPVLPVAEVGASFSLAFTGSGGSGPLTFAVASGSLPTGLGLSSAGVLSGLPQSAGIYSFVIRAVDTAGHSGSQSYSLAVTTSNPPATITVAPAALASGAAGVAYSQTLTASGGTAPYTFAVISGSLPAGLTLNGATGVLSGTPEAAAQATITIRATDAASNTGSRIYSLSIAAAPIVVEPATLANATVGVAFNQTVSASGGTAPYAYSVSAGALPAGLALESSSGTLSGVPQAAANAAFTVTAVDANSYSGSQAYTLTVACPTITLSSPSLADGTVGQAYSQTISASGGTAGYSFAVTAGSLPPGLSLSNAGALTGTPTAAGSSGFTVTATDANHCVGTQAYVLTIGGSSAPGAAVEFLTAGQMVGLNATDATVRVVRTGPTNALVSVGYTTVPGSAAAGTDYATTAGMLTFAPGATEQTVTVPILQNKRAKNATRLFYVDLVSPSGATLGARHRAAISVGTKLTALDGDGDQVTLRLSGHGSMVITVGGDGPGLINQITLTGTDRSSRLTVTVKKAKGGDGVVTVGAIVADGSMGGISAPAVSLVGSGLEVGGYLGTLALRSTVDGVALQAGGTKTQTTTISLRLVSHPNIVFGSNFQCAKCQ